MKLKGCEYRTLISAEAVPELHKTEMVFDGQHGRRRCVRLGGAVTLTKVEEYLKEICSTLPGTK
jgi:hypothetical protein